MNQNETTKQQITRIQELLTTNPPPVEQIRQILAGLYPFVNKAEISQITDMIKARLANPPQNPDNE